nr:hypothetical protein [Rhizobium leguminosarum]
MAFLDKAWNPGSPANSFFIISQIGRDRRRFRRIQQQSQAQGTLEGIAEKRDIEKIVAQTKRLIFWLREDIEPI